MNPRAEFRRQLTRQDIRLLWLIHDSPALEKIKALGQWNAAREFCINDATESLAFVFPDGNVPALAHCHALESAAIKWLKLSASAEALTPTSAAPDGAASQPKEKQ